MKHRMKLSAPDNNIDYKPPNDLISTLSKAHSAFHFLVHILYVTRENQAEGRKSVKSLKIYLRVFTRTLSELRLEILGC